MYTKKTTAFHESIMDGGCAKAMPLMPALPLSMVREGKQVCVSSISGKDDTRRFLSNLGFVENAEATIVSARDGSVIVNVKGTRVAISKTIASRVMTVQRGMNL